MTLPHRAGNISNREWSKPNSNAEDQDLQNGFVVGQDNFTGETIATDGSTTTKGTSTDEPQLGQPVDILRPNSSQKARKTVFKFATFKTIKTKGSGKKFTGGSSQAKNVSSCGSSSAGGDSNYEFPEPPEEPPEEPPIDEIPITPEPNPLLPEECQEPKVTVVRKRPEPDTYYPATSIDEQCPLGMYKLGYADLGGGEIYIQCRGESFGASSAVPVDPTTYGYDCSPCGTCIKKKGGKYPTLEICQSSGCAPVTFKCTPSGCIPVYDGSGNFGSLIECQNSCTPIPYECINGECVQTLDGKFATLAECQTICNPPEPELLNTQILVFISTSNRGSSWSCLNMLNRTDVFVETSGILTDTQLADTGLLLLSAGGRFTPPAYECREPTVFTPAGSSVTRYYIRYGSNEGSFIIVYQGWASPDSGTGSYSSLTFTPY